MNIKNLIAVAAITASAMVSTHSFADTNITENVTLTADTDWSGLGLVTIESGVTVELSGCKLSLDGLAGEGSIVTNAVLSNDLTNPTDAATAASTTTNGVPVKMTNDLYPAKFAFNDVYADATGQAGGMLYADNFSTLKFVEINYDFGEPKIVSHYAIMGFAKAGYNSCPKAWTFEGSDDFATWTQLDSRSNQTWKQGTWNKYNIENTKAYRYYRLKVTAVTGTGTNAAKLYIAEIEYKYAGKVEIVGGVASDFSALSFSQGTPVSVAGNVTLTADADFRSTSATVSIDGTIDLNGNRLAVDSLGGSFTDTSADAGSPGELHVNVASGTVMNSSVSISGNLKLVKEGAGTFVSAIAQTYSGGTLVAAGTLRPHDPPSQDSTTYNGDAVKAFGNGVIAVASNAVFDVRANYAYNKPIRLEGGAFACTGPYDMTKTTWGGSGFNEMTADSTLAISNSLVFQSYQSKCDLGGHKLTVRLRPGYAWYLKKYDITGYPSLVITNGAIDVVSGGWMQICAPTDARTVDFKINCALKVDNPFSVRDYEARFYSTGSNGGTAQMTVAGVFKPTVAAYYGCTMLAGSTMDLTVWPGAWPMASAFTKGKTNLEFADSGEITVNLAGRDDLKALARSANPYLITWTVVPGADFVLDSATAAAGYRLRKDATGLKVETMRGLIIIFN